MPTKATKTHRAGHAAGLFDELLVDNFAGGGGASLGIERAVGRAVDVAINHDRNAVELHALNHPATLHHCEDVWAVDPEQATGGRPVGLAWFSPDCKHFSRAKGGKPVEKKIRGLAWVVVRWAAKVAPRVIVLENVREFESWGPLVKVLGDDGHPVVDKAGRPVMVPCKARKGLTFRRWVGCLRGLGYAVEWRHLDAADFGAPTHRRRLFLIARRDGRPIRWPEPTHGPGRAKPHRTAAECIDWSIPCPSIFLTREQARPLGIVRPLADKTMRRIAMGLKRFVLDNPRPFIVRCDHGGAEFRGQPVGRPLATVAGKHGFGVVAPFLAAHYGEAAHQDTRGQLADEPLRTVTPRGGGGFSLIVPSLIQYNQEKGKETRGKGLGEPLNTVPTANRHGLVAAHISKFYGGVVGSEAAAPLATITATDHNALAAAYITRLNHGDKPCDPADEPLRTVVAQGNHHALTRAFLAKYYGTGAVGQVLDEPLHTATAKARFGLVTVDGEPHQIIDIGLRMLRPRELFRAQGFPDSYVIDRGRDGRTLTIEAQVKACGNSVCPPIAEAIVRANYDQAEAEDARPKSRRRAVAAVG